MRSSVIPSAKYCCFGMPLRFSNGSTASEGLSTPAEAVSRFRVEAMACAGRGETEYALTGSSMFLTTCSPRSV